MISFRLPPFLKEMIKKRAEHLKVSMTKVILDAIYTYLATPIEEDDA